MAAAIGGGFAAYSYFQAQPCATFPSALSDPAFQRAVGIGMLAGAVGGLVGGVAILGAGAFGGGLAGAVISGAVGGGLAGGVGEALRQVATYGHIRNPQLLGAAMLSGVVSGGVFGAVGYGIGRVARPAASGAGSTTSSPLLEPPKMQKHHIFPQSQGLRDWFASRGIDIDLYTVELSEGTHLSGVHGRGGFVGPGNVNLPGRWNALWQAFKDANPNATAKEIYQFAGQLMDLFGLSGLPIVPY